MRLLLPKQALVSSGAAVAAIVAMSQVADRYGNTNLPLLVSCAALLAAAIVLLAWLNPNRRMLLNIIRSLRPVQAA